MLKLVKKALLFLLILFIIDFAIGTVLENMYFSIETGTSGAMINHLLKNKYDVYIMGASAAQHGYIPEVIESEIGMSVYNAGEDGTNVFYRYSILQLILAQSQPKLIIWDVSDYDFYFSPKLNPIRYLLPYCSKNRQVKEVVESVDNNYLISSLSHILPYNQKIAAILSEYLSSGNNNVFMNGYIPNVGEIDLNNYKDIDGYFLDSIKEFQSRKNADSSMDALSQKYFHKIISDCNERGIPLILFFSPRCPATEQMASVPMISDQLLITLEERNVPTNIIRPIDYPELNDVSLFRDLDHLNNRGAIVYSRIVSAIVKRNLLSN